MSNKIKKIIILFLFAAIPFLTSCNTNVISNPDVQTLTNKAAELMEKGDYKGAVSRLESINDLNPNFPQNHYNLGVAYYQTQEYEKAVESLNTAISMDKNIVDAYYTLALAYHEIAVQFMEKLEKPEKSNSDDNKIYENKNKIIENLNSAKENFIEYKGKIADSAESEKIKLEIENIDEELKKYEEKKL